MIDYSLLSKKRTVKQFFMAIIFIAILIFGWRYPVLGYFIPFCMILGIVIGLKRGRKWCDWYCPRGSFYDSFIKPISSKKQIPFLFKNIYFRIFILLFLMAMMAVNLIRLWPSFSKIGLFFVSLLTITTTLGIILAIIFQERTWCSFCPIGTVVNLTSRRNKYILQIDSDLCIECKQCFYICPMQIKPYSFKKSGIQLMSDPDCIKCGSCVAICPKKALNFKEK